MRSKSLNIRVPRLGVNRYGVFYVRSSELDGEGQRKVTQQSLGTKNPLLAKILALRFCLSLVEEDALSDIRKLIQSYELDLSKGIAKAEGPDDHARMMEAAHTLSGGNPGRFIERLLALNIPAQASLQVPTTTVSSPAEALAAAHGMATLPKPHNVGLSLRQALDDHLHEEAKTCKSKRTLREKSVIFKEFSEFFGDVFLNQITLADISARWRPSEFRRPNQKQRGETLSVGRLEKRRGFLSKFFEWAEDSGFYMHPNPMGQHMATKRQIRAATRSYKEFTSEDLGRLFGLTYREKMDKPDWYWVPLIALYSGARLSEIADLALSSFETIDGVDTFFIADSKTPDGRRTVPVHSALVTLGLLEYVDFLRQQGETHLFGFRPDETREKSVGRQWGKWVDACGIDDPAKTFHSFRSTAITDMHNSQAPNVAAIRESVGHSTGTGGVHGNYIRGVQLVRVRETIENLHHTTVDLNGLKLKDPTFSDFYSSEKARLASPAYLAQIASRQRNQMAKAARLARLEHKQKRAG